MNKVEVEIFIYPKVTQTGTIRCKPEDTVEILKIKLEGQTNIDRNNIIIEKSGNALDNDTVIGNFNKLSARLIE